MRRMKGLALIGAGGAVILAMAGAAHAQDTGQPREDAQDAEPIVVTAQRKSERLETVPISITALSGDRLEQAGIGNVRDLQFATPGLRQGSTQQAIATIRGVTTRQTDPGNDPNVALYIDGVYQSNNMVNNADLPDIERIEVLKGPQGTLFGRNATGGAIRVFTRTPSFEPSGSLDFGYGNFNRFSAKGFITGPVVEDRLAASFSAYYEHYDGYNRDIVTGQHSDASFNQGARLKLLFTPTTNLDVTFVAGFVKRHDGNLEDWTTFGGNGNSIGRLVDPVNAVIPTGLHDYVTNVPAFLTSKSHYASLTAELRTSIGVLTSITSYSRPIYHSSQDGDYSSLPLLHYDLTVKQRTTSQELIFSSTPLMKGFLQITGGLFYYHDTGEYDPLIIGGAFVTPTLYGFMEQRTNAYSAFAEADLAPVANLHIIAGARYSIEERDAAGVYGITPVRPTSLPSLGVGHARFERFTPRLIARYSFDGGDNIYASFSQGFKSGGFNIGALQANPFLPEKLTAFEAGFKSSTSRAVSGTFAAFYYDYTDQQVQSFVNGLNVTTNAGNAEIYGAEAELRFRPVTGLQLVSSLSYLHARYKTFKDAIVIVPIAPGCRCGNTQQVTNLDGGKMPDAPRFTFGQAISYSGDIGPGELSLSGQAYYSSSYPIEFSGRFRQASYWNVNARAEFRPKSANLSFYVWGRNLTNEATVLGAFISESGDGVVYNPPRTYGIGAKYSF